MRFSGFQCPGNEWIARVWLFFRHAQTIARTRSGYAHNCEIMRGWRVPFHCRLNSGLPGVPGTRPRDNALRRITEFNEAGPPLRDVVFPRRDSVSDSKRSLRGAIRNGGTLCSSLPMDKEGRHPLSMDRMRIPFSIRCFFRSDV